MSFIDFQQMQAEQEQFRIIEVKAWGGGEIRLNRLSAAECINLINLQDDIEENENGKVKHPAKNVDWAVDVCSRLIANEEGELQYNTPEGRRYLSLEYAALNEILPQALEVLELDDDSAEKKRESIA